MKVAGSSNKIAFGGGCHWCTEAVFQSLSGVKKVVQGFVSSSALQNNLSEAVLVYYDVHKIGLEDLIAIHLHTHKSTANHRLRKKYRSAIYTFSAKQAEDSIGILSCLQANFSKKIITEVLPFKSFKPSELKFQNYYYSNPKKPFCQVYINPKLQLLLKKFTTAVDTVKVEKRIHQPN